MWFAVKRMREVNMDYRMVYCRGHIEVVDFAGRFVLSADTVAEAYRELSEERKDERTE